MTMYTSNVKWFDNEKGYGFISGNDVFIHHSQVKEKGCNKDLHQGESITFDVREEDKGPIAINVKKL